jgi:hypothetical protein
MLGQNVKLRFLAESGSSASFISPDALPKELSKNIENFLKTGNQVKGIKLKKTNLTIKSA